MSRQNNIKSSYILFFCSLIVITSVKAQEKPSENIVVVTLDGLRWQEVFSGADSILTFDTTAGYNTDYIRRKFWANSPEERRLKLLPFLWTGFIKSGVLL